MNLEEQPNINEKCSINKKANKKINKKTDNKVSKKAHLE